MPATDATLAVRTMPSIPLAIAIASISTIATIAIIGTKLDFSIYHSFLYPRLFRDALHLLGAQVLLRDGLLVRRSPRLRVVEPIALRVAHGMRGEPRGIPPARRGQHVVVLVVADLRALRDLGVFLGEVRGDGFGFGH